MNVKYIIMECPNCGEEMRNEISCIGTPTNEFDVFELEQSTFYCEECEKTYYIGDIDYFEDE